ncbi:SIR2-like protein involved in telomeric silencing, partial [Pseudoloma neurophilia]
SNLKQPSTFNEIKGKQTINHKLIDDTWFDNNVNIFLDTHILLITGAGISTPQIPDFRSENGLFKTIKKNFKISGKDCFDYKFSINEETRASYIKIMSELSKIIRNSQPNEIHKFFSYLKDENKSILCLDQNIDVLTERSGLLSIDLNQKKVKGDLIYLHGRLDILVCTYCGYKVEINENIESKWSEGEDVECPACIERVNSRDKIKGSIEGCIKSIEDVMKDKEDGMKDKEDNIKDGMKDKEDNIKDGMKGKEDNIKDGMK